MNTLTRVGNPPFSPASVFLTAVSSAVISGAGALIISARTPDAGWLGFLSFMAGGAAGLGAGFLAEAARSVIGARGASKAPLRVTTATFGAIGAGLTSAVALLTIPLEGRPVLVGFFALVGAVSTLIVGKLRRH